MARLMGISGSLRKGSYNTTLLRLAAGLVPDGSALDAHGIDGVPLYSADVEAEHGIPPAVQRLKDALAAADGLLLVTPEYNNSIPGVFKNAIDWMSRPANDIPRLFDGKPVAVIGASMGGFGTVMGQNAWLPVLRTLGTAPWFGGRLLVSRAASAFDAHNQFNDAAMQEQLRKFMHGFCAHVDARIGAGN